MRNVTKLGPNPTSWLTRSMPISDKASLWNLRIYRRKSRRCLRWVFRTVPAGSHHSDEAASFRLQDSGWAAVPHLPPPRLRGLQISRLWLGCSPSSSSTEASWPPAFWLCAFWRDFSLSSSASRRVISALLSILDNDSWHKITLCIS